MKIHCIFVKRLGKPASARPELSVAVDEDSDLETPEFLEENKKTIMADFFAGDIESYRQVDLEVPDQAIEAIFAAPLPLKVTSVTAHE